MSTGFVRKIQKKAHNHEVLQKWHKFTVSCARKKAAQAHVPLGITPNKPRLCAPAKCVVLVRKGDTITTYQLKIIQNGDDYTVTVDGQEVGTLLLLRSTPMPLYRDRTFCASSDLTFYFSYEWNVKSVSDWRTSGKKLDDWTALFESVLNVPPSVAPVLLDAPDPGRGSQSVRFGNNRPNTTTVFIDDEPRGTLFAPGATKAGYCIDYHLALWLCHKTRSNPIDWCGRRKPLEEWREILQSHLEIDRRCDDVSLTTLERQVQEATKRILAGAKWKPEDFGAMVRAIVQKAMPGQAACLGLCFKHGALMQYVLKPEERFLLSECENVNAGFTALAELAVRSYLEEFGFRLLVTGEKADASPLRPSNVGARKNKPSMSAH